jgi:hypothetical protein
LHNLLRIRTASEFDELRRLQPFYNSSSLSSYALDRATLDDDVDRDSLGFSLTGDAASHERFRVLLEEYIAPPAHERAVTERGCQAACELAVDCGCVVWIRNLVR